MPLQNIRKALYYMRMNLDGNRYAKRQELNAYPHLVFGTKYPLHGEYVRYDLSYHENMIHNIKLAAAKLDGIIIEPGETFSFWSVVKDADEAVPYKKAYSEVDGKLKLEYGGGLSVLSNHLCWLFLHTPLKIKERHGRSVKMFPDPSKLVSLGTEAIVREGYQDLKVANYTYYNFQLAISFDDDYMYGAVYADCDPGFTWKVINRNLKYVKKKNDIYEEVDVVRQAYNENGFSTSKMTLYHNSCRIKYPLPDHTVVSQKGTYDERK